jgi:hypothetical protein
VLSFRAAQVSLRAGDVACVLDALAAWNADPAHPLHGRVDASRAAVAGHSFGGAAAAAAAQREPRLRAAVLLDAWQWPLGAAAAAAGLPVPSLLFESAAFLGDRDAFCAFNSRMSSEMASASSRAWKLVARVGHYEYTDMALTAPLFMRVCGLVDLRPRELEAFQRYQNALVLSFLRAHILELPPSVAEVAEEGACGAPAEEGGLGVVVAATPRGEGRASSFRAPRRSLSLGAGDAHAPPPPSPRLRRMSSLGSGGAAASDAHAAAVAAAAAGQPRQRRISSRERRVADAAAAGYPYDAPEWVPPRCQWVTHVPRAKLAAEVEANEWTPPQRAAMRLLLRQIRRGDYEIWALSRHAWESLPDTLALVIHTRSAASLRDALLRADAELKAEEAEEEAARQGRGGARGGAARGGARKPAEEAEAQRGESPAEAEMVVISR